jgi:hypothetical protein
MVLFEIQKSKELIALSRQAVMFAYENVIGGV